MDYEHRFAEAETDLSEAIWEMAAHGIISEAQADAMNDDLQALIDQAEHTFGTSVRWPAASDPGSLWVSHNEAASSVRPTTPQHRRLSPPTEHPDQ